MLTQMLAPAAVLIAWSMVVMLWMAQSRFAAMAKVNIDLGKAKAGGRGQDLDGVLPPEVQWKSHNYTHLMEQPTVFYPVVVILALTGPARIDVLFAWAYVAIRIVHSLWQIRVNRIPPRALLFFISSLVLIVLAVRALMATLFAQPGAIA